MKLNRRDALATLLAAGFALRDARADESPRKPGYGVLSLIGHRMDVVTYHPAVGSRLDTNDHQMVDLVEDLFDVEALRIIHSSLQKADNGPVTLYRGKDPALFERPLALFDGDRARLPDQLITSMRADGAERLLLVTRHRREADLHEQHGGIGSGPLEGMGYYIDGRKKMRRSDTGEIGRGFLAPFVYLRLTLVDLADQRVLKEQMISGSTTLSVARAKDSFDPWDVLTAEQKINTLLRIMDRELRQAVPKVIDTA